jgi:hypothetical protein
MKKKRARLVAERIRELVEEIIHLDRNDPQLVDDAEKRLIEALSCSSRELRRISRGGEIHAL